MKQKLIIISLFLILVFLLGCVQEEQETSPVQKDEPVVKPTLPNCEQEWQCIDSQHKVLQTEECTITDYTFCKYGCLNGECADSPCASIDCNPICDGSIRKYNGECLETQCVYQREESCLLGCNNGKCNSCS